MQYLFFTLYIYRIVWWFVQTLGEMQNETTQAD
jgi:hypothetical protein